MTARSLRPDVRNFGKAIHEAMLEGWAFSWLPGFIVEHVRTSSGAAGLRGWSAALDFPRDPDGLDDIDPMVERRLRPYQRDAVVVFVSSDGRGASWVHDLFERTPVTVTEPLWLDWNAADANPIADIQRAIYAMDRAALKVLDDMRSHDPHMDAILALRRLPMTDKRVFIEQDPEPSGRRYGPYDADPHTKGRRRRFRNQRRT